MIPPSPPRRVRSRRARTPSEARPDPFPADIRDVRAGAGVLSDAELVAIVTADEEETGDLTAAHALIAEANLVALIRRAVAHPATPALQRIAAAVELVRRATEALQRPRRRVNMPLLATTLVLRHAFDVQERVGVVLLDSHQRFLAARVVFVGTHSSALASTRDIVGVALAYAAAGVIVYHNHPSGNPAPSQQDRSFTRELETAVEAMDITLVDHLILGANAAYSYRDDSLIVPRTDPALISRKAHRTP
jgi:DNA repair protein RadC